VGEPESPAAQIVDALLEEGEPVDEGQFTLDPAAAAAKLEAFSYADRSLYLIPIMEGLIGLGVRELAIETARKELVIRTRGLELDLDHVERWFLDIYAHAIGHSADALGRAFGRLAIGFDMVLGGATSERVGVHYSDESAAVSGEYRYREAPRISREQSITPGELSISIDRPWRDSDERDEVLDRLRTAVAFSTRHITLDGATVSRQPRHWHERRDGAGPGYRFVTGFEQTGEQGSVIELWTGGVCVGMLAGTGKAFRAVIELEAPRRDLSRLKVVRDETVERALAEVEQARVEGLHRLAVADASWTNATRPSMWPPDRVDRVLGRPVRVPAPVRAPREVAVRPVDWTRLAFEEGVSSASLVGLIVGLSSTFTGLFVVMPSVVGDDSFMFVVAMVFVAIGLLLMVPRFVAVRRVIRARDLGVRTRAKIVGFKRGAGSRKSPPRDRVLWSFSDDAGMQRTGRSFPRRPEEASRWQQGEEIAIYYDSARPHESWWEADVGPRAR
jgi:VIT1/CCC1 family predicted Fe2+/Mn2+ transporter